LWNEQQRFCGRSDVALSARGKEQARWLGSCLAKTKISACYSSDLRRARETAELIAAARSVPLSIQNDPAWREIDFGAWEGLTYAEIEARFPTQLGFFEHPETHIPPGGESLAQLSQRVLAALLRSLEECASREGDMVIVSHGGPLRVLLSSMLGVSLARQWQFGLRPGSLSALDLCSDEQQALLGGSLALFNLHSELRSQLSSQQEIPMTREGTQ
jgi:broad specificity phosphatase PhoE